jgi:hypothetical protein
MILVLDVTPRDRDAETVIVDLSTLRILAFEVVFSESNGRDWDAHAMAGKRECAMSQTSDHHEPVFTVAACSLKIDIMPNGPSQIL